MSHLLKLSVLKISILITLLFGALHIFLEVAPHIFPQLSTIYLKTSSDLKFLVRGKRAPLKDIILVTLDNASTEEFGRWPWKRTLIAEVLQNISNQSPKIIGIDIPFPTPDPYALPQLFIPLKQRFKKTHSEDPLFQEIIHISDEANSDLTLSRKIKSIPSPVVMGFDSYFYMSEMQKLKNQKVDLHSVFKSKIETLHPSPVQSPMVPQAYGLRTNILILLSSTPHHGFLDNLIDLDGTSRQSMLILQYGGQFFPSAALKIASLYLNADLKIDVDLHGVKALKMGNRTVPTNQSGQIMVNFAGKTRTYPHIHFSDVYHDRISKDLFTNKIVLLGIAAKSMTETGVLTTPLEKNFLSLEFEANVIENLIQGTYLVRPSIFFLAELLILIVCGLFLILMYQYLRALPCAVISLSLIALYTIVDYRLFSSAHLITNSFIPSLYFITMFLGNMTFKYFSEEKQGRTLKNAFQHYVNPAIVTEIIKDPKKLVLGGEKKELTVLFADIRGFTTISEKIPPEMVTTLLNQYMTLMTNIILGHHGMLDKYVGDEIIAIFGAPVPTERHASDACHAAVDMIQALATLQSKWQQKTGSDLKIGIGINTGPMILGNMGSEKIFNYTVIGDAVNLASRLQGLTKTYQVPIIVSRDTHEIVKNNFKSRPLDSVEVRGKANPIQIFEIVV